MHYGAYFFATALYTGVKVAFNGRIAGDDEGKDLCRLRGRSVWFVQVNTRLSAHSEASNAVAKSDQLCLRCDGINDVEAGAFGLARWLNIPMQRSNKLCRVIAMDLT